MQQKQRVSIQFEEESKLFPEELVKQNFNKCANTYHTYSAIPTEIANRLASRLLDTKAEFNKILDLGAGTGTLERIIKQQQPVEEFINLDICEDMLGQADGTKVVANAEENIPFEDEHFDLVISNLMLPWINDIPKCLHLAGKALKKDGLFIASTLGLESFKEFREAFEATEQGGSHIVPLPDVRSVGQALQRRGFALPVVDKDIITLSYPDLKTMYEDIKALGARNLNPNRDKGLITPRKWKEMEVYYQNNFKLDDGSLALTLEVIYLHGWHPHESQQKPLKPGSAQTSLSSALTEPCQTKGFVEK